MQITNTFFEKNNKHHFYSLVLKKLTSLSSHMLCRSYLCLFFPISQKEHWPQGGYSANSVRKSQRAS
jgi:hypothetical protein